MQRDSRRLRHEPRRSLSKLPLLDVFREARRSSKRKFDDNSSHAVSVRRSITPDRMRRHIMRDLASLLTTTQLQSTVAMDDTAAVSRSIVNFGVPDLNTLRAREGKDMALALSSEAYRRELRDLIEQSLLTFEPRIIGETLEVELLAGDNPKDKRLSIRVRAEYRSDPSDIRVEFVGEVDLGAGRVRSAERKRGAP